MASALRLILLVSSSLVLASEPSSFHLILNVNGTDNQFRFVEVPPSAAPHPTPSVLVLNDSDRPIVQSSSPAPSARTFQLDSERNVLGFAAVSNDDALLYAVVQTSRESVYDVAPIASPTESRTKRSTGNDYIIRSKNVVLPSASARIEWDSRHRRDVSDDLVEETTSSSELNETRVPASESMGTSTLPSFSLPDTMENITIPSADNETMTTTTPRPIPEKSRHLYLEIIAVVDSLVTNDLRALLNKTELEAIEILKLYYIHVFMGVEHMYRQSLIYETLDVHIRLTKIIFATDKHRLPWESFKNVSALTKAYRQAPNNFHVRPNISMNLLKSLHHAYAADQFDKRFFDKEADHVMTFTRLDLIDGAGSAYVQGACLHSFKYSIIQEDLNAFSVTVTVAHELGHNLGLDHDESENTCNDPRFRYIMSPKNMNTADRRQLSTFSECSVAQLNRFADNTSTTCWKNHVVSTRNETKLKALREVIALNLGKIVNIHEQCRLQYGPRAVPSVSVTYATKNHSLYEENICNQLRCFKAPEDDYMYWQEGAFDGSPCGENRVCQQKQCVATNQTTNETELPHCPYGDLAVPIPMLSLRDRATMGNMLCPDALDLLRSRGMNVTQLCYDSVLPFRRLCCEECKKHLLPECGDLIPGCASFRSYCDMPYMRVNGMPVTKICAYTCGQCPHLPPPPPPPTTTTTTTVETTTLKKLLSAKKTTTTKKPKTTTPKPRKYTPPESFDDYTCIDSADCAKLAKTYSKAKKNVKNWCTEHSTMVNGKYFAELCPKYCSLCNVTSECDRFKLCRNNGTCIRNEHGTYQCLCPSPKFYGPLCEYRRPCMDNPCSPKTEFCVQTDGENYVCLSKEDREQIRVILDGKK